MSLRHFIIPLQVEGETKRASLNLNETGDKGRIDFNGQHVCDFELETAWAIPNYFVAEKLTRVHLFDILGIQADPVSTGYTPA